MGAALSWAGGRAGGQAPLLSAAAQTQPSRLLSMRQAVETRMWESAACSAGDWGPTSEGDHLRLRRRFMKWTQTALGQSTEMSLEPETVSVQGPRQASGKLPRTPNKSLKEQTSTSPRALSHTDLLSSLSSRISPSRTFLLNPDLWSVGSS